MIQTSSKFKRDRFTWAAYLMLGYYAYSQTVLGPAIPFLRDELNLSYTVAGFHATAFALGMILAGLTGSWLAKMRGRRFLFWGGSGGMSCGVALLGSSGTPILTILSAFIMGWFGTLLLVAIQATLAEHHGPFRGIALTESNIFASVFATLTPLCIGIGVASGIGWKVAPGLIVIYWIVMFILFRAEQIPAKNTQSAESASDKQKLPRAFWAFWIIIFLGAALEWTMAFWGADYLKTVLGLPRETAATLMTTFFLAMILGRIIGSRLTHHMDSARLLPPIFIIFAIGFILFWAVPNTIVNILGLFIIGLGIANAFPLGLAAATTVAPAMADSASAKISLAAGAAILLAPQILGAIADQIGIQRAYAMVIVMLLAVFITLGIANYLSKKRAARSSAF